MGGRVKGFGERYLFWKKNKFKLQKKRVALNFAFFS